MSRYMQIRLNIEPAYRADLKSDFPKLAEVFEFGEIEIDPFRTTLYKLIREVRRASHWDDVHPQARRTLEKHLDVLGPLEEQVSEKLSAWKLEGLDDLLYKIEDAFEDLEKDLD